MYEKKYLDLPESKSFFDKFIFPSKPFLQKYLYIRKASSFTQNHSALFNQTNSRFRHHELAICENIPLKGVAASANPLFGLCVLLRVGKEKSGFLLFFFQALSSWFE